MFFAFTRLLLIQHMKNLFLHSCTFILIMFASFSVNAVPPVSGAQQANMHRPLLFTENRGQVADADETPRPDILFTAHSGSVSLFLTGNSIYYQFTKTNKETNKTSQRDGAALPDKYSAVSCRFSVAL